MKFRTLAIRATASICVFASLGAGGCNDNGQNNSAVVDLMQAFQSGCSLDGNYLQLALNQTQNFSATVSDLQKSNSCAAVSGTLNTIQNLQTQIASVSNSANATQISNLAAIQKILMLQINASSNDPSNLANLSEIYGANLLDMGEAQAELTAAGVSGQTSFQIGSDQLNGYVNQLLSDQSNILACAKDNPALAAQLGAGMIAVAGSFTSTVAGTALSLAGGLLNNSLNFLHQSSYSAEIDNLDQIGMMTALPCGLEQMMDVYCQAQDIMDINHLETCAYNPAGPGCPTATVASGGTSSVSTTVFWQGMDVLTRQLPAVQLWLNQVVTGITPASQYAAQQINDPRSSVSTMDSVSSLAQGVMNAEAVKIATLQLKVDQDNELRNGLNVLINVLGYDTTSTGCAGGLSFGGGCNGTALLTAEGSGTQILYDLVNRDPKMDGCNPSNAFSGSCPSANSISLEGLAGADDTAIWQAIEANAGGLPITGGKALIDKSLSRALALLRQQLNTDPSDLLEKVNSPVGEGLPSPIKALQQLDAFLKSSLAFFSDSTQVPDALLDGGPAMRPGIVGLLKDSEQMVSDVIALLGQTKGNDLQDLNVLTSIYNRFQLAKDRNFVFNRVYDQIKLDLHTRIMAGQVPNNIYDILSQNGVDPTVGLTQIPATALETTPPALAEAQITVQKTSQEFASFFAKSFNNVLQMLIKQANDNQEPTTGISSRTAPNRAAAARVCLLLVSSQNQWPSGIDPNLCKGLTYTSELTQQTLNFDSFFAELLQGKSRVPERMCTFYHFYRESQNFVQEKQGSALAIPVAAPSAAH